MGLQRTKLTCNSNSYHNRLSFILLPHLANAIGVSLKDMMFKVELSMCKLNVRTLCPLKVRGTYGKHFCKSSIKVTFLKDMSMRMELSMYKLKGKESRHCVHSR